MKFYLVFSTALLLVTLGKTQVVPPFGLCANISQGGQVELNFAPNNQPDYYEDFEEIFAQDIVLRTPEYGTFIVENGYLETYTEGLHTWNSFYYTQQLFNEYTLVLTITNVDHFNARGVIFNTNGLYYDPFFEESNFTGYTFLFGYHPAYGGEYSVGKYYNGFFVYVIYWTQTDVINIEDGDINTLKVVSSDGIFDYYINDIYVDTFQDNQIPWGYVGGLSGDGNTVRFNEISCTRDAQLMDRSIEPRRGRVIEEWLDPAGNPTDQPPRMSGWPWDEPDDARGAEDATTDHPKNSSLANPRQQSLRGHQHGVQINELDEFVEYRVYRNGNLIGTTQDTVFTDQLPQYGTYDYHVTAYYDPEGESIPSITKTVTWHPVTYAIDGGNVILPSSGGTITYSAQLFNELPISFANVTYRTFIAEPPFYEQVYGPLFERNFTLTPGWSITIPEMTQVIPAGAVAGMYLFTGKLLYNSNPVREQSFYFHKMSGGE